MVPAAHRNEAERFRENRGRCGVQRNKREAALIDVEAVQPCRKFQWPGACNEGPTVELEMLHGSGYPAVSGEADVGVPCVATKLPDQMISVCGHSVITLQHL